MRLKPFTRAVPGVLILALSVAALSQLRRGPIHVSVTSLTEQQAREADSFEDVLKLFTRSRSEFEAALGDRSLSPEEEFLVFANYFSYLSARYGNSGTQQEMEKLLQASELTCDNYAALVVHLFQRYQALHPGRDRIGLRMVGWHGKAFGNHSQLFAFRRDGTAEILLDPTVALIAFADFEDVASGHAVPDGDVYDFATRSVLARFREKVAGTLTGGRAGPLDLLYYYENPERFFDPYSTSYWPTPGAARLRQESAKTSKVRRTDP